MSTKRIVYSTSTDGGKTFDTISTNVTDEESVEQMRDVNMLRPHAIPELSPGSYTLTDGSDVWRWEAFEETDV